MQRGMNFRLKNRHSVILMSRQPNAPYQDQISDDGSVLIYEGHDTPNAANVRNPKALDQPEYLPSGNLTENGKFHRAAQQHKMGSKHPDIVQVYEKIKKGIWSDNGYFHLIDSWQESDGVRKVFKFKLVAVSNVSSDDLFEDAQETESKRSRIIPSDIKFEVFKRDRGRCVECGATDELHFDHIIPYSKGGTSLKVENVQLLCARHNLSKSDKIQ
ncbi:HNH endonuclease [Ferrimonas senticii]|uniref:HNH endonuclease n=1 Tax=Ferrimonas senticii TaxID=394566 RepID=UPI001969DCE3|nr:HNH endonuclease [Ferrimonas senticii]